MKSYKTEADIVDSLIKLKGDEFSEYRKQWDLVNSFKLETEFPLFLHIETSYQCNFKCPMCVQGQPALKDKFGYSGRMTTEQIRKILEAVDPSMCAMVLLGINAGFGNTDCARLPISAVDLEDGWIDFPRPKTAIQRRIPLWPETMEALRTAIDQRPEPKDPDVADLCFVTVQGAAFVRTAPSKKSPGQFVVFNTVSNHFARLLKRLGINGRKGLGFYTLRHNFETIAGESRDQVAVNSIMGHADSSMAAAYRERISDERLQAVVEVVRKWLFDSQD